MSATPGSELLRPTWIVAHLLVLAVVVTFPQLGMWQLDRWHEEHDRQERIDARIDGAPVPIGQVLSADTFDTAALEFQPVTATGTYAVDEEVAHRNRDLDGQGGFDWLTPLVLEDGSGVLVRRGFVPPTTAAGNDPTPAPPPSETVTVTGFLEVSGAQPTGIGARDSRDGVLGSVFHSDVARIDQQTTADLLPMVLHLTAQDPAQPGRLPVPQPTPQVDLSQNLSYAVQWFTFTAIAAIGYAIVLWRRLHGKDRPAEVERATTTGTRARRADRP